MQSEVFEIHGSDLVGLKYKPLFPYFKDQNAFVVLHGDFVSCEEGTGLVHMAPCFGEDDYDLCKKNNINVVCPVDASGKFMDIVNDIEYTLADKKNILSIAKENVFDTNDSIIMYLKGIGSWLHTEQYVHNYPYCWRTDTPLIYMALNSWYVKVTDFKDRLIELNQQINWIPEHVKDGLFGKWLANTRDWAISRHRFWGCPVPVWKSDNPQYPRIDVYGSIEEMERDFSEHYAYEYGEKLVINDLHRPFIDKLKRPNPNDPSGKSMMIRVEDVLDCWFESGAMPYAAIHYPFEYSDNGKLVRTAEENQAWFDQHLPADFIVEYVAQTRGWFYSLMVLSVALFDRIPFKNCICHGVILDDNSQKLSKRLQNYTDPMDVFNMYGSDAMRFAMCSSAVMRGSALNIDKECKFVKDVSRTVLMSIWNSFNFFKTYFESDFAIFLSGRLMSEIKDKAILESTTSQDPMDIYILTKLREMIYSIRIAMDKYDTISACNAITIFIEVLNNWYIRGNRHRFWSSIKFADQDYHECIKSMETGVYNDNNMILKDISKNHGNTWRIQKDDDKNIIIIIDDSKYTAYQTLYTVLLRMSIAMAPLLPCLSEKIYLDLR